MTEIVATNETILVVGGGISGMTAALEAAETGKNVVLVEKNPGLGRAHFPALPLLSQAVSPDLRAGNQPAPPEEQSPRARADAGRSDRHHRQHRQLHRHHQDQAALRERELHRLRRLRARGRHDEVDDPFNYNLGQHKAAYLPNAMAYPQRYVLDPSIIGTRRRRQGQGRVQIRRDRSRHEGRDDPGQGRRGGLGDRLAALRCGEDSALRLRPLQERHHQRRIRAPGRHRTAPPAARSCAPATARKRRTSPSSSAPVRATKTICAIARASAAWPR